jgi:nucleoside 2-deoxyribosyltransferase
MAAQPPRVYLAGPDVFLPNAWELAERKRKLCRANGLEGVSPLDADPEDLLDLSNKESAMAISRANEELIRGCKALIANLTPFRGPSADVGTAYELGFARALYLPVFGYSNQCGTLLDRTTKHFLGRVKQVVNLETKKVSWLDPDQMKIEDFELTENLMLVGAVEASESAIVVSDLPQPLRFSDPNLHAFELCVKMAAQRLGVRVDA